MKKMLQTVTAFLVAFAMVAAPVAEAQSRGRQANTTKTTTAGADRAKSSSRSGQHQGNSGQRPAAGGNQRPGSNGGSHRPSAPSASGQSRPGGTSRPGSASRPGKHNGSNGYRPGSGPVAPHHGNVHHSGNIGHGVPAHGMPHRPAPAPHRHDPHFHHHVPFFGHYSRPVPPPRWHYHTGGPAFGTILGVALGTAIGVSINALVNSGYAVSSYGDDVVYLTNVPQMNYTWPDAALYYTNGILSGSQFTCPSAYYDMTRYNSLYNAFTAQYGMPVQAVNRGGVMSATWYGAADRYVNLSFGLQGGRYYTTLSFGN